MQPSIPKSWDIHGHGNVSLMFGESKESTTRAKPRCTITTYLANAHVNHQRGNKRLNAKKSFLVLDFSKLICVLTCAQVLFEMQGSYVEVYGKFPSLGPNSNQNLTLC